MAAKLIGYARVSTRAQDTDRQIEDLLAAGVRHDDLNWVLAAPVRLTRTPQFESLDRLRHAASASSSLINFEILGVGP